LGVSLTAGGIWLVGIGLLAVRSKRWALGIVLVGLLIAPVTWSFLTTFNPSPNTGLPKAGPVGNDTQGINPFDGLSNNSQTTSMDFLTSNTAPGTYLLAVESANEAAPYILATGRPVLTFGGFLGTDNIIDATGLAKMVSQGKLRYVAISEQLVRNKPAIAAWVKKNCTIAILPGNTQRINNGNTLYDCAKP
jgi:4-amino-4-deoxy-L-arabinose transferase-like glycosyltransferase